MDGAGVGHLQQPLALLVAQLAVQDDFAVDLGALIAGLHRKRYLNVFKRPTLALRIHFQRNGRACSQS
jgi:hypothetical protein